MRVLWLVVIVLLIVVASIGFSASSLFTSPGVSLLFEFYGRKGYLRNWLGYPTLPSGRVYVEVYAITPPTYNVPEVKVWNGSIRDPYLFIPYSGEFRKIVDGFSDYLARLPMTDKVRVSAKYGLRIDFWVFMDNGTVISGTKYTTYSPWSIHSGGRENKIVDVDLSHPVLEYNISERIDGYSRESEHSSTGAIDTNSVEPLTTSVCVWLQEWIITPDDLAAYGVPYIIVDGVKYIEVPVAIIDNKYSYSGIIDSSFELIATYSTALTVSIGVGYDLSSKVAQGSYDVGSLGVTLYKSGYSVEKNVYYYNSMIVNPEETVYYYIYARPYTVFEKEVCYYYGSPIGQPTGNERIRSYVADFLVNGQDVVGGVKNGWPPSIMYSFLYDDNSSTLSQVVIPSDPALYDGDLDVGESVAYAEIFNYYDTCDSGFEVSVPLGLIAAGVCTALTDGACAPFATLLASIPVSLELNPSDTSISVYGGLKNCGSGAACNIQGSTGYDTFEVLYARISKLKYRVYYWSGGYCDFNVPVSMYFRSD